MNEFNSDGLTKQKEHNLGLGSNIEVDYKEDVNWFNFGKTFLPRNYRYTFFYSACTGKSRWFYVWNDFKMLHQGYWYIYYSKGNTGYTNLTKVRPLFTLPHRGSDNFPLLMVFSANYIDQAIVTFLQLKEG